MINSFKFPKHEILIKSLAEKIGYKYISCSHEICPLINYTIRGYTTTADNYLNPVIKKFTNKVSNLFKGVILITCNPVAFLATKKFFWKNFYSIWACRGVNAGIHLAKINNDKNVIGFDMGGTSTDVWHYAGEVEKRLETKVSGYI